MRTLKEVEKDIYILIDEAKSIILKEDNENISFRLFSYYLAFKVTIKEFFVNCENDINNIK